MNDTPPARTPRLADLVVGLLALSLVAYSIARAHRVAFTIDEAASFLDYARSLSYLEIVTTFKTATNHMLSTLGMKACLGMFGASELSLRLPSILAHVIFLLASALLLRRFPPALYVGGFIMLNANPYLLDFFSVARGYGIAGAATMTSLACFVALVRSGRAGYLALGFAAAAIGVLGNFALLHYYLSLLIAFNAWLVGRRLAGRDTHMKTNNGTGTGKPERAWPAYLLRHNAASITVSALLALVIYDPIRQLRAGGELYFGGVDGFWQNTVGSLIYGFLYSSARRATPDPALPILQWVVGAIVLVIAVGVALRFRRGRAALRDPAVYAFACLVLPAFSAVFQFHLLGTKFVILRTALFFLPLFVVSVCFGLDALMRWKRIVGIAAIVILATGFVAHSARKMNTYRAFEWAWCFDVREFGDELQQRITGKEQVIVIHWLFRRVLEYYRDHRGYAWILPVPLVPKTIAEPRLEHYLVFDNDAAKFPVGFEVVRRYERWVSPKPGTPIWMRRLDVQPVTMPLPPR